MIEKFVFILLIISALYIVFERGLKRVVIATCVFSLIASFCYLLYHAPDVALAEAIIGSALSTILYIISLKKYHSFYIFITSTSKVEKNDMKIRSEMRTVHSKIMDYCAQNELSAQYVYTWDAPQEILKEHVVDLILQSDGDTINIYGLEKEIHSQSINQILQKLDRKTNFVPLRGEEINEVF